MPADPARHVPMHPLLERLRRALRAYPPEAVAPPSGGRVGAALVLLSDADEPGFTYTRRRDDLAHHPGQISFPGGRVEPGETIEAAALREASEEVGLHAGSVEVLGRLPAFYIPPSRFWLQAVCARWRAPHPLNPAPAEVAEVLRVPLSALRDRDRLRVVRLVGRDQAASGWSWAWRLDGEHLLWGATALVTTIVLDHLDPTWHGGVDPAALATERELRPWERRDRAPRRGRPRLPDVPEVTAATIAYALDRPTGPRDVGAAAAIVADAAVALGARRVVVLAGNGRTGAVGRGAAAELRDRGLTPAVLTPGCVASSEQDRDQATHLAVVTGADLVIDALVGAGLDGPLRGGVRALVHALRHTTASVLSVDLPSGIDQEHGLIGDAVTADVTIAVGGPRPGLFHPGLAPYVGDLYVARLDAAPALVRVVPSVHEVGAVGVEPTLEPF